MNTPAALVDAVACPLVAGFERLAALRGGEAVHRSGLVVGGRIRMRPGCPPTGALLLDRDRAYAVQARLSWGVGAGGRLPDLAGLGVRVLDADGRGGRQDLLVSSSLPPPHSRLLLPRRGLAGWYGTPLRLRLGEATGPLVHLAARVVVEGGGRHRLTLAGARAAATAGRLQVLLVVHDGHRELATGCIALDEVTDPANPPRPRFDMGNAAGGLVYAGFWQAVRRRTYAASRRGDPRTGEGSPSLDGRRDFRT
jgi:hypothetical protein